MGLQDDIMRRLKSILQKRSGRAHGKVVVRHQGGGEKRFMREVDFKRSKLDVWGKVEGIEYDPNRNAFLAVILYTDGVRAYILAPVGLKIGDKIIASEAAPVTPGNALPLKNIPVGALVHNIEITKGKGGQIVKSAGNAATIFGKEEAWVLVKLPSGEIRRFGPECFASIGQIGNEDAKNEILHKAGRVRHMGIRPSVRGVAMNPDSHPHGGGEGRSGIGMPHPKTVYGRSAVGKTRNKKKYSNRLIVQRKGGKSLLG
ncbi:MAG: 50S ribosomal protein L2, large subunit ribosomal protein L2 [Microgenomates group bacterium GW2011_GWC1_39_7b]|uniref:Large ribosomal subunit protein uL2 n=3 Tax=Candidatus Woeseibacteriota TaxID=1752722 RepID=A0A0G0LJF5_9BACT|nr:MAG: 50S ribosomal protein L2 [Candidatus Woesebacteria bacterium GW2011_GWB1_39_10]KKR26328.1 MAG: 50S ribosomal protein L2, large subunit ribosomal protein L2 [Microgenomates group bacterium GW2011_GWC1_39_7b]KKR73887.1 MAG: 50S ribosomal protein L2 [Candidatus Woesebacteria bacterium GW2011_GWA2_40_7]KKS91018.1 MAG: 50S ribosomal protein L2 [Candidatus Woesebacteria bacterium GW2011_GWA1_43_12]